MGVTQRQQLLPLYLVRLVYYSSYHGDPDSAGSTHVTIRMCSHIYQIYLTSAVKCRCCMGLHHLPYLDTSYPVGWYRMLSKGNN